MFGERDILTLPDFDDVKAATVFLATLEGQSKRHGVKKLLSHSEAILRHKGKVIQETELAERALLVVNGKRTPLQTIKDKTRHTRSNAEKFYSTMSTDELLQLCIGLNIEVAIQEREYLIDLLICDYVYKRTYELTEQYGLDASDLEYLCKKTGE
jgi:hypothetical protein